MKQISRIAPSKERMAVELVLRSAVRPMTMQEIADVAEVTFEQASKFVSNYMAKNKVRNLAPKSPRAGQYVWMETVYEMPPERFRPEGFYDGAELRTMPARGEAAMRAYSLPSRGIDAA